MQNLDSFRKDLIKKKHFLKWLKMTKNAFLKHLRDFNSITDGWGPERPTPSFSKLYFSQMKHPTVPI